jgi:hypothetical protein
VTENVIMSCGEIENIDLFIIISVCAVS